MAKRRARRTREESCPHRRAPSPQPGGAGTSTTPRRANAAAAGSAERCHDRRAPPSQPGDASISVATRRRAQARRVAAAVRKLRRQGQKQKKPRRYLPGPVELWRIMKFNPNAVEIPFAPFVRLVREITEGYQTDVLMWTPGALLELQEGAECYMAEMFQLENVLISGATCATIKQELEECRRCLNPDNPGRTTDNAPSRPGVTTGRIQSPADSTSTEEEGVNARTEAEHTRRRRQHRASQAARLSRQQPGSKINRESAAAQGGRDGSLALHQPLLPLHRPLLPLYRPLRDVLLTSGSTLELTPQDLKPGGPVARTREFAAQIGCDR
ncbi:hypothetical protein ACP70R_034169 [Stipagrostis hirtigluma subsp. patula]